MQEISTQRLIIRRFYSTDYQDLYEYLSNPTIVAFEPYPVFSLNQCKKEAYSRANNNAFFAICLKDSKKLIGNLYLQSQEFNTYELGYVLNSNYQNQGYATEAAGALMDYAFHSLNARRIIAFCSTLNTPSWKLMERLHMRREGCFLENASFKKDNNQQPIWFDSYSYAILATEYEANLLNQAASPDAPDDTATNKTVGTENNKDFLSFKHRTHKKQGRKK